MKAEEAAQVIRTMADSVENDPNQFHIQVITAGVAGISHGGGTGLASTAVGGQPGSVTVGTSGTARGGGNVQIQQGDRAAEASLDEAVQALRELAQLAESGPSRDTLWERVQQLNQIATMPSLIVNASATALKLIEMVP